MLLPPKAVPPEQASPSPRSEVRRQRTDQLPSSCLVREEWDELPLLQGPYPPSSERTPPVQIGTGWRKIRLATTPRGWPLPLLTARHRHSDHRDAIDCGPSDHRGGNGPEAPPEPLRSLGRRLRGIDTCFGRAAGHHARFSRGCCHVGGGRDNVASTLLILGELQQLVFRGVL